MNTSGKGEQSIVILIEREDGRISSLSHELASLAFSLNELTSLDIKAVIPGENADDAAKQFAEDTGIDTIAVISPDLSSYNCDAYKAALEEILPKLRPAFVCISHTSRGADLAPGLAVRLKAACLTGVEKTGKKENAVTFSRMIAGDKLTAEMVSATETTVLTAVPGSFKADPGRTFTGGSFVTREISLPPLRIKNRGVTKTTSDTSSLSEAKVIVSAGRGIGKEENLDIVFRLAGIFPHSAVGGSRPVCDSGWLEYSRQVGVTGTSVSPDLYIACGISGASQHVNAIKEAGMIVAINSDPNAAIFNTADICIVEDVNSFIPDLIDEYEESL